MEVLKMVNFYFLNLLIHLQLKEREVELRKLVEQLKSEKEENNHQISILQQGTSTLLR